MICGRNRKCATIEKKDEHSELVIKKEEEEGGTNKKQKESCYLVIEKKYDIIKKLFDLNMNIAIQGEITGPAINGNRMGLKNLEFNVFDIYDIKNKYYLKWSLVEEICTKLNFKTVDVVYRGLFKKEWSDPQVLLEMATNTIYTSNNNLCEGLVVKTETDIENNIDIRKSFKVISNKYLLKYNI